MTADVGGAQQDRPVTTLRGLQRGGELELRRVAHVTKLSAMSPAIVPQNCRIADHLEPHMTFNLMESRWAAGAPMPTARPQARGRPNSSSSNSPHPAP